MRSALGLAAYRALTRRSSGTPYVPEVARPSGPVVWLHAGAPNCAASLRDLAFRLRHLDSGLTVLITVPLGAEKPNNLPGLIFEAVPNDDPASVRHFLRHWDPQAGLWAWGGFQANLLLAASEADIPLMYIDAAVEGVGARRDRWTPDVAAHVLRVFDKVLARSETAFARLQKSGCSPDVLELSAPLMPGAQVMPAAQSDLDDMTAALAARPVWYADGVAADEVPFLLDAQRSAQRSSHRLLLVAAPVDAAAEARLAEQAAAEKIRTQLWSDGDFPDETTSLMLADIPGEAGLWFRIAPLAFMGSSLGAGARGRDPLPAAALGAAVLYGPRVGEHLDAYKRLADAGAARIVNDGPSLAAAVAQLIAPDQAARMALAGWEVVTAGSAATDRVVELVFATLEGAQVGAE